jgi:hypothetical protein
MLRVYDSNDDDAIRNQFEFGDEEPARGTVRERTWRKRSGCPMHTGSEESAVCTCDEPMFDRAEFLARNFRHLPELDFE